MNQNSRAAAVAGANFALVKYWGKRSHALNLPAVGSISITVDTLITRTSVTFRRDISADVLILNKRAETGMRLVQVTEFLDQVRELAGLTGKAVVRTDNTFPTGAGLASSASGFAALALAATKAAGLTLSQRELSVLARRGSGSAARSVFGGFVEMKRGSRADGQDAAAAPLLSAVRWPLSVLVAVTSRGPKETGSRNGMRHSAETSPFYSQWVADSDRDLSVCRDAILNRDFEKLAEVSEFNCLKMHAVAMSSRPGLLYWNSGTVRLIHETRRMRQSGIPVFFTIDAGPQVKLISPPEAVPEILKWLNGIPEILERFRCAVGEGVHLVSEESE